MSISKHTLKRVWRKSHPGPVQSPGTRLSLTLTLKRGLNPNTNPNSNHAMSFSYRLARPGPGEAYNAARPHAAVCRASNALKVAQPGRRWHL